MRLERTRAEGCLSDLVIDRWVAGELAEDEVSRAAAHEVGCERCRARVSEIRGEAATALPPLQAKVVPLHRARKKLALGGGLAGAALAAGLALFVVRAPEVRTKGAPRLGFWVKHGEHVRAGGPGEVVQPGDALRFGNASGRPAYLAVLSVDPARKVSVYYPADGRVATEEAGALPLSTILDDTVGTEVLYGVFCREPFDVSRVRAALESAPDGAPPVPEGCTVDRVAIEKRPSP